LFSIAVAFVLTLSVVTHYYLPIQRKEEEETTKTKEEKEKQTTLHEEFRSLHTISNEQQQA
jgi:uncharacterized protein HemX